VHRKELTFAKTFNILKFRAPKVLKKVIKSNLYDQTVRDLALKALNDINSKLKLKS
jgi:hypothetical protein